MVDEPILSIKLLALMYLFPEPDSDLGAEPSPSTDFLLQNLLPASTFPVRRRETRRAANEDGRRGKRRISRMRLKRKGDGFVCGKAVV